MKKFFLFCIVSILFIGIFSGFAKDAPEDDFGDFCKKLQKIALPKELQKNLLEGIRQSKIPEYFPLPKKPKLCFVVQKKDQFFFLGFAIKGKEDVHFYPIAKVNNDNTLSLLYYSSFELFGSDHSVEFYELLSSKKVVFTEDEIEMKIDHIFCQGESEDLFSDMPEIKKKLLLNIFHGEYKTADISLIVGFYHRVGVKISPYTQIDPNKRLDYRDRQKYIYFGEIRDKDVLFLDNHEELFSGITDQEWMQIKIYIESLMEIPVYEKKSEEHKLR